MVRKGRQSRLFDDGDPVAATGPGTAAVGPASVPDEVLAVAERLPRGIFLGTSSWSFPGWQGIVYDRAASKARLARQGLAAYARHPLLRAVGIDRTYYSPLSASEFSAYAADVPDGFRFLVKAWSRCTTPYLRAAGGGPGGPNERFLEASPAIDEVIGPFVEGLREKAGPLVFQFPPLGGRFTREPSRFVDALGRFLGRLPAGPTYAVEIRDPELLGPEYFGALEVAGARHCLNVHPRMPSIRSQQRMGGRGADGPLVARWMLHSGLGYQEALDRYEPFSAIVDEDADSRRTLAQLAAEHARAGIDVVVIANNKAEGSAPLTLYRLAGAIVDLLRRREEAK